MQIKKILWATDGSKEADEALRWAKILANRFGAKVIALNVLETLAAESLKPPNDLKREISLIESETGQTQARRLTRVSNMLQKIGIKSEARIKRGIPYEEITKAALSGGIDLIAMGKRGVTRWGRMLLGSTTSSVLRGARVPVLVVKRGSRKHAIKKILLPISFSSMDRAALEWALELARKFSAVLFVLHVIEAHKSYGRVKGGFVGRLRQSATRRLRAMLDSLPSQKRKGVSLNEKVTTFPRSWSGIVNFAEAEAIDMIVMSTQARKGVPRFLLGSVADNVIQEAPCAIIAVAP